MIYAGPLGGATGIDRVKVKHKPRLLSDNGPCYIAGELSDYLADHGMTHTRGRPYHPQTQGKILLENLRLHCSSLWTTTTTSVITSHSRT